MSRRATWRERLVLLAGLEAIAVLIALVLPITPSKTGPPGIPWPDSLGSYLADVLLAFGVVNAIFLALALVVWAYSRVQGIPFWAETPAEDDEAPGTAR